MLHTTHVRIGGKNVLEPDFNLQNFDDESKLRENLNLHDYSTQGGGESGGRGAKKKKTISKRKKRPDDWKRSKNFYRGLGTNIFAGFCFHITIN